MGGCESKESGILRERSLAAVADYIKEHHVKNIITMAGAGISTAAGVPDFRSPGSGLYTQLKKYNLPTPWAIFSIDYFDRDPAPFFDICKSLWPETLTPTETHHFLRLLHEEGLLLRHYTQNIDTLEMAAGLPADKVVEAHGSFFSATCRKCSRTYQFPWVKKEIFRSTMSSVPRCEAPSCGGVVKPDVVLFGEGLPSRFFSLAARDFPRCDLLIVLGTSLVVQPFSSLVRRPASNCPRLVLNLTPPPTSGLVGYFMSFGGRDFQFNSSNLRDVLQLDTTDKSCRELARLLGWEKKLSDLVEESRALPLYHEQFTSS